MIEPQRLGRFLDVDRLGQVIPDVAPDRIEPVWKPLVAFVCDALMDRQGVSSLYLRGSIPRGLAIEYVSDADFFYLSEINFDLMDIALEKAVLSKFPFTTRLELSRLDRAAFDKVRRPQRRPYFHMLLKTQCLFLAGDDVAKDIGPFQLGADMVSHVFSLASEFSLLPAQLEEGKRLQAGRTIHQWFSRRIVRSGFEITMDRTSRFTRDLYLCYEEFARFYPDRAEQMLAVLVNSLNGDESPLRYGELVAFLTTEAKRLLVAVPQA